MFTLLQDSDLWLQTRTGSWVNYVWVLDPPVTTKISGLVEPFRMGETSLILPEGVSSSNALVIYTEHNLKVYNNIAGNESIADAVFLQDPDIVATTFKYIIMDKEVWDANASFTLIPPHNVYLAVRVEQQ